jgi:hypothetical protein
MPTAPTRNGIGLDQFNDAMRQSPAWRSFMQRNGQPLDGRPIRLSEGQRQSLASELRRAGFALPNGVEVDPAGNINQDNTGFFEKTSVRIALAGAAAAATAGALGWGPLAGLLSSGGQAGAGGTLASSSIPGLHSAVPGAIASQGASAGIGAAGSGALASSAIPGLHAAAPGAIASQGASAAVPGALGGAAAAASGAARGAGGGGLGRQLLDNVLSPEGILGLAGLIPARAGGGRNNIADDPNVKRQMDIANQSQQMQLNRYQRTDPLHEASVRLAYSMLPMSARSK